MAESEKENDLKGLEKEALKKIQGFIDNDTLGWVLRREDLQSAGIGGDGYDEAGVKRVLHEFEAVISQVPGYEIGVIFDKNGRFYKAVRGRSDEVSLTRGGLRDRIFTHNHPDMGGWNFFSYGDIKAACGARTVEIRAVEAGGKYVRLTRLKDGNTKNLIEDLEVVGYRNDEQPIFDGHLKLIAEKNGYLFDMGIYENAD